MSRLALFALALSGCNQWVRPAPPTPEARDMNLQRDLTVMVEVMCHMTSDILDHGEVRAASGVIVSDWQVLTAYHVVECPTIPTIWVTTNQDTWRFAPERDWESKDVSRIQMASADRLRAWDCCGEQLVITPPVVGPVPPYGSDVYVHAALPSWGVREGRVLSSYRGMLRSTAPGDDGVSGAGVYDDPAEGRLIAIHTGIWENALGASGSVAAPIEDGMVPR